MKEYIFKTTNQTEWQKWLNQWKHDYELDILKIVDKGKEVTIYLTRQRKEDTYDQQPPWD